MISIKSVDIQTNHFEMTDAFQIPTGATEIHLTVKYGGSTTIPSENVNPPEYSKDIFKAMKSTENPETNEFDYIFYLQDNITDVDANVIFSYNDPSTGYESRFAFLWRIVNIIPIYKDTIYTHTDDIFEYDIYDINNNLIFSGKSVSTDYGTPATVHVARLVENNISPKILYSNASIIDRLYDPVKSYFLLSKSGIIMKSYKFIYDWTYETDSYNKPAIINVPINGRVSINKRCIFMALMTRAGTSDFVMRKYNNRTYWTDLGGYAKLNPQFPTPDARTMCLLSDIGDNEVNFASYINAIPLGKNEFVLSNADGTQESVTFEGVDCDGVTLLYLNKKGGFDTFLFEGNTYKYDNYEKITYKNDPRFVSNGNIGESVIYNSIYKSYTSTTGWLTDEQAERLVTHLLSSPTIYIYNNIIVVGGDVGPVNVNIKKGLIPVKITDTRAEYKKFKNGRKLIQYTIEYRECENKIIK